MAKSAEAWAEGFDCRGDVCVFEPCRCRLKATPIIAAAQAEARAEALEEAAKITDRRRNDCDHLIVAGKAIRALSDSKEPQ